MVVCACVCVRLRGTLFQPTLLLLQLLNLVDPKDSLPVWLVVAIGMVNLHLFFLDPPRDKRNWEDPSLVSVRT